MNTLKAIQINSDEIMRLDFEIAGLTIKHSGGYWLKPLSDKQIQESWTDDMLNAFFQIGEDYPEIAAEIYAVAGKKS